METAIEVLVKDAPGVLNELTGTIKNHNANIIYVDVAARRNKKAKVHFELEDLKDKGKLKKDLEKLKSVFRVDGIPSFSKVYGKRIIVVGGGAQVAEVAKGAINEADRHNIRGEKISVDTIPLVGEKELADAVYAVARLPRAGALVLAGSIMGGDITNAIKAVKDAGIVTISLNMAGSVPKACDLIVTDPIQAGVMAVMAVADTAKFDITKQRGKKY